MKLDGECLKAFEKWYIEKYLGIRGKSENKYCKKRVQEFHQQRYSEKYGVYVDFFDSVRMHIATWKRIYEICDWRTGQTEEIKAPKYYTDRPEARIEAINKANELFNNK